MSLGFRLRFLVSLQLASSFASFSFFLFCSFGICVRVVDFARELAFFSSIGRQSGPAPFGARNVENLPETHARTHATLYARDDANFPFLRPLFPRRKQRRGRKKIGSQKRACAQEDAFVDGASRRNLTRKLGNKQKPK